MEWIAVKGQPLVTKILPSRVKGRHQVILQFLYNKCNINSTSSKINDKSCTKGYLISSLNLLASLSTVRL